MKGGMHFYRGSGAGAARYFDEGHQGAEAYYTEDARVAVEIDSWRAGERHGETVLAEPGDLIRWVEGVDLATGEVKGLIRSGGKDRLPLRFVEVVVNNPKSLSIVASQNSVVAAAVDGVLSRQTDEIAKYLSMVAVTRVGGRGVQVEVGGLTVETARVRHLTSREGDPHRHVHLMVNTRVQTADGEWRGLHSAAVRQHIRAVNERGSRMLVTDRNLREVLASEGYTLGADGEIDQARAAVEVMSKRSAQVAANRERAEAEWRGLYPGREPSQRVRNGWDQQAWAEGRKAKPFERESSAEMSERVRVELAEAGFDFTVGAHRRGGPESTQLAVSVGQVDRDGVAVEAVAVLSGMKSAWSEADLTAVVEARVAGTGVVGEPVAVGELVDDVRARAAGRCVSVLNAGVHVPTVMSRHLSSAQVVDADMRLNLGLAGLAGGPGGRDGEGGRWAAAQGLDSGQASAVGAVCGDRRLEVVVGPAGTGKTRMLQVAGERLAAHGRDLRVVSPTLKGAQVAGAEVGVEGVALSKLLFEHGFRWDDLGRWTRLEAGQVDPGSGRIYPGPGEGWGLSERSVVVVDEAGLTTVDQANALVDVAAESGAAIRLVGDPRQLGAVGRGGVMETAARWADEGPVALDQVHRFLTVSLADSGLPVTETDVDYAALSQLMRDGAHPDQVADRLAERGAVVVHPTAEGAVAAIAAEVASLGEAADGLAVTVATNEQAGQVNQAVRQLRVAAGQVDDTRTTEGMGGVRVGVGDRVVTRRNDASVGVANRETWTVEAVTGDGAVVARSSGGSQGRLVRLEADYVAAHTQLGYATTDYGNQGVTANRSVTWVSEATTSGGLYVGATRGRYENTVHVVADTVERARAEIMAASGRDRADRGLEAARVRAETDAVRTAPAAEVVSGVGKRVDPAGWRTVAELDAATYAVESRLAEQLRSLEDVPVLPEAVRERENNANRVAAREARGRAAQAQRDVDEVHAGRYRLAEQARADYFAARDDARIVQAGPGRLRLKAGQVDAAQGRRDETARRWFEPDLPRPDWTDQAVRHAADRAAERAVTAAVTPHQDVADREAQAGGEWERRIADRERDQRAAVDVNRENARQRQKATAVAAAERDRLVGERDTRAVRAATMTATQIADADQARSAYAGERRRLHQATDQGKVTKPAGFDPARWRTAQELDRAVRVVENKLATGLRALPPPVSVMADEQRERENQADRAAADLARERATTSRAEAEHVRASRDRLIDTATVDYLAAREDARIVEAGPGRFGRKTGRVDAAQERQAETARTWATLRLPQAAWSDQAVRAAATAAAERTVATAVNSHKADADRAEQVATSHDQKITARDHDQQAAIAANERISIRQQALVVAAGTGRDKIAGSIEMRAEQVENLTPEQLAAADHTRSIYNTERTRQHQVVAQREHARHAYLEHRPQGPVIDPGVPGIEM